MPQVRPEVRFFQTTVLTKAAAAALGVGVQSIMTNYNFIESANVVIKSVAAELRTANKEYTSISRLLKDIQRKDMLKAGYGDVFAAVGIEAGTLTPAQFFASLPEGLHRTDKKGQTFVGVWGYKTEEDGTKTPVLRKVTAWTPNKLFKVLAQAKELKATK